MNILYKIVIVLLILSGLFLYPFDLGGRVGMDVSGNILVFFNALAFIAALISYIQFIFPKQYREGREFNRIPFQIFNILFISLFFIISIAFMISNKQFYSTDHTITNEALIKKYYISNGFTSLIELFIASSLVINVIYILTHLPDYYGRHTLPIKKNN